MATVVQQLASSTRRLPSTAAPELFVESPVRLRFRAAAICIGLLISSTILQKIAIPFVFDGNVGFTLLLFPALTALGFFAGVLVLDRVSTLCFACVLTATVLSIACSESPLISVQSALLLWVCQLPLIFRLVPKSIAREQLFEFMNSISITVTLLGILQFLTQFVLGAPGAFALDRYLPKVLILQHFNYMIPLKWGSTIYKSNGVFLLEPSFFGQLIGLGFAIELNGRGRFSRLAVYLAGLVFSYSGTGIILVIVVTLAYTIRTRRLGLIGLIALFAILVLPMSELLHLNAITDRATEIFDPHSSGTARFRSIFYELDRWLFADRTTAIFGRGPGTVREFWKLMPMEAFDPTWGKLVYEYGMFGALCFALFYVAVFARGARLSTRLPLLVTFFFLGGYTQNPMIVAQLAVLLVWPANQAEELETIALGAPETPPPPDRIRVMQRLAAANMQIFN